MRDQILFGDAKYYLLAAAVVMPDHVHLILKPNPGLTLSKILQGIKGATANKINNTRNTQGTLWQSESFDRILRDEQEFQEKLQYMADNPLKAGLISPHESYDAWLIGSEFQT